MAEIVKQNLFIKRLLTICAVITLIILGVFFLGYVIDVLMLAFAAILLAVFLHGLANLLGRFINISTGKSVLIVSLVLLIVLGTSIALLAPSVGEQIRHLREELPNSARTLSANLSQYSWGREIIDNLPSTDDIVNKVSSANILSSVGGFFSSTVGMIANFFIAILLAIYLATEPQTYTNGFAKLFPINRRERVGEVLAEIGETLQWWLIGKSGSMLVIGILTWIGLSIIGVPLALTLGLIAGLLSFIPNFGPILSAIPALLLAFIESPVTALYVIGLYIAVQLIESNLVTPWIERQTVELPPALTILAQLILAVLIGGLGLVLATPVVAVGMVLVQMLYIEDILGDADTEINEENEPVNLAEEKVRDATDMITTDEE